MADEKKKLACQIEVESKEGGFTRIAVAATTEDEALKLFKKVKEEIKKDAST